MAAQNADFRTCPHCGTACAPSHQYCPACGFPIGTLGTSEDDKFIGKTLPGGYHILDLISVGGMGRVYRAEQSVLGRTVAVKIIHPHLLSDENSAVRFMTEARAASQLNHPNSVAVFDFGRTDDGQPYLVMEFLRGKDLARVAYEEGPLPFGRIVDVLRQVLTALAEAHELGIVHRDLKPENVILEPLRRGGDFVKVVDFGLAKLRADRQAPSVTSPGIVCGTPDYMAPEQGRGDAIDGRSDLYAVGVMLFQLLTGQLPYEADNPTQVVMMHMTMPIPDPRQVTPERDLPDSLVAVVNRAMAKNPAHRYQDATEFAEALAEAIDLARTTTSSPPPVSGAVRCAACGLTVPPTKFCGECGARLSTVSAPPSEPPQFPLAFVGRDPDLNWLEQQRQKSQGGLFSARIIAEPGFGKTRLLSEFARLVGARGGTVVEVSPDPYLADVANHTLRQTILRLAPATEDVLRSARIPGTSAEARRGLGEIFGSRTLSAENRTSAERRYGLAEALRWAIETALEKHRAESLTILVDDLHRVDAPSRNAFTDVVLAPPIGSVLLVAAHVPSYSPEWGERRTATRTLGGLTESSAMPLLKYLRPQDRPQAGAEAPELQPLYLEELIRYCASGGSDAPPRLGDLIARRLDTLEPMARRVLQAIVVLGDELRPQDITQLVTSLHDAAPTLERLAQEGFIRVEQGLVSAAHPLPREVVLAGIPHAVRRELHEKALRVCEKALAPIEARAQHAYFSQDSFQALLLLEQVAERAQALGAWESEITALRRGLELARQEISRGELDDPLRAVLIFSRKLGSALARSGSLADAEGVLREALDLTGPSGTDRARVLGTLAQVAYGRHREAEAFGYIDQAIEAARNSGEKELLSSLSDTRTAWAS